MGQILSFIMSLIWQDTSRGSIENGDRKPVRERDANYDRARKRRNSIPDNEYDDQIRRRPVNEYDDQILERKKLYNGIPFQVPLTHVPEIFEMQQNGQFGTVTAFKRPVPPVNNNYALQQVQKALAQMQEMKNTGTNDSVAGINHFNSTNKIIATGKSKAAVSHMEVTADTNLSINYRDTHNEMELHDEAEGVIDRVITKEVKQDP